jgi:hypothetical protein
MLKMYTADPSEHHLEFLSIERQTSTESLRDDMPLMKIII